MKHRRSNRQNKNTVKTRPIQRTHSNRSRNKPHSTHIQRLPKIHSIIQHRENRPRNNNNMDKTTHNKTQPRPIKTNTRKNKKRPRKRTKNNNPSTNTNNRHGRLTKDVLPLLMRTIML